MDNEVKILRKLDMLEKKIDSVAKGQGMLIDVIQSYNKTVNDITVLWKKDKQEKLGLTNKQVGLPRVDDEMIVTLRKQGVTMEVIGRQMGVSTVTISNHIKKLKKEGRL